MVKSHYGNQDFYPLANCVLVIVNKTLYWKLFHYGPRVNKTGVADIAIHIHLKLFLSYKLLVA